MVQLIHIFCTSVQITLKLVYIYIYIFCLYSHHCPPVHITVHCLGNPCLVNLSCTIVQTRCIELKWFLVHCACTSILYFTHMNLINQALITYRLVSSPVYTAAAYTSQSIVSQNRVDVYLCTEINYCHQTLRPGWLGSIECPPETLSTCSELWQYLEASLPVCVCVTLCVLCVHCVCESSVCENAV